MNRFPPNRMAIAALTVLALFVCAERAQATDISGTIISTLTISTTASSWATLIATCR